MSPTPLSQRSYHATLEARGDIRIIDDGDILVETTNPWQTWIGEPGVEVHSTKFFPPERLLVPRYVAEGLVKGNAAKIIEEPDQTGPRGEKRKRGRPKEDKALRPSEDKGAG